MRVGNERTPEAWVPTKDVLQKTRLFLDRFEAARTEINEKQARVNELLKHSNFSHLHKSWLWAIERDVFAIHALASASIDGRILLSPADLMFIGRATPSMVDDAIRDLEKDIAFQSRNKCERDVVPQPKRKRLPKITPYAIALVLILAASLKLVAAFVAGGTP